MIKQFIKVNNEYNLNGNYLLYFKILSNIPKYWLYKIKEYQNMTLYKWCEIVWKNVLIYSAPSLTL